MSKKVKKLKVVLEVTDTPSEDPFLSRRGILEQIISSNLLIGLTVKVISCQPNKK